MDMSMVKMGMDAVLGGFNTYYSNKTAEVQAKTANAIRAGNNTVLDAVNAKNAVLTGLQRWRQQVNNSRVYEAAGVNQEAMAVNFNRARDQKSRANFSGSIRDAEQLGRQQASAAASGITGSVVDVIDSTSRIRMGMERVARVRSEDQALSDYRSQESASRWATLDSLDYSIIMDNQEIMDFGKNTAVTRSPLGAAVAAGLGSSAAPQALSSFSFKKQYDPVGDFYLRGNTGTAD